jgi:hypothetical protein
VRCGDVGAEGDQEAEDDAGEQKLHGRES